MIVTIIIIVAVFVYSVNLTFGQEERYQNGTRIISLLPVNLLIDNVKESYTEEFEGMLREVGN
ncbi:MAG: hypothetical protein ACRD8Z_03755 [Nitrososphaeraceae archaeon]